MTQRILVTGGAGLLGSYLLRWFRKNGYTKLTGTYQNQDAIIPADLKDGIQWRRLRLPDIPDAFDAVKDHDWVIHSAALVSYFKEDKYKLMEVNQTGTEHIVNACIAHDVKHFVFIGSIGALGKEGNNITLNELNGWHQNKFTTSYALSKYLGELEAWRGAAEGLNVSVILPSVILGSGDWQRSSLQIIDRVARKTPMYPSGQTGYVDVRDVATFVGNILEKSISGQRWLLNGANLSYRDIYALIAKELSLKRNFREAPQWLAKAVLLLSNLKSGRWSMPEITEQIYGTFTYDALKSTTVEDFHYRPIEETIRDVARAYKSGNEGNVLEF